jgi:hypothetical protein
MQVRRHLDQHSIPLKVRREVNELFDSPHAVDGMSLSIGKDGVHACLVTPDVPE